MNDYYVIKTITGFYVKFEGNNACGVATMVQASILNSDTSAIIGKHQAEKKLGCNCIIYKIELEPYEY